MSQRILQLPELGTIGRFGNALMFYALGKWFCNKYNAVLQTPLWIGDTVFEVDDPPIEGAPNVRLSWPLAPEMEPWEGIAMFNFAEYSFPPMYTDEQFRSWLRFRPQYQKPMFGRHDCYCCAHVRRGDFASQPESWPQVSKEQIEAAIREQGLDPQFVTWITEEVPHTNGEHPLKLSFLEDFLMMVHARNLFVYPSSSFSGCAARFNRNNVFVPMDYHNGQTDCIWVPKASLTKTP